MAACDETEFDKNIIICLLEVVARNRRLGPLGINNVASSCLGKARRECIEEMVAWHARQARLIEIERDRKPGRNRIGILGLTAGACSEKGEIASNQFPRKKTPVARVSNHEPEIVTLVAEAEQASYIRDRVKKALEESSCRPCGLRLRGVVEAGENPSMLGSKINNPS